MNRKLINRVAIILSIIIVALSFSGCGENEGDKVDIGYISGNYQMIVDSSDEINCDYLLVYRSNASYYELDAFVDFLDKLSVASTASFQICPDTLNVPNKNQKIILLGSTVYGESNKSESIMENIRPDNYFDYLLRGYSNILSVTWKSKYGREDAFNYILNNLLADDFDKNFTTNYSYMYLSDRTDTPAVTIDDINIMQYSVVMSGSPSYIERMAAEKLVSAVKASTGVDIPLVTDAVEESRYEILVGDTNRGETYVTSFFDTKRYAIAQYGTKLILRGGQIEATAEAVNIFADTISNFAVTAEPLHIQANYCKTGSIASFGGDNFAGYKLVYDDEFNQKGLDTEQWLVENGAIMGYGDASALMFFRPNKVTVDGSNMVISTVHGTDGYISGHVTTQNSFSYKYGYCEVRARFRATPGFWVKMVLTNINDNKDSVSQIDVFNSHGSNEIIFGSLGVLESDKYYDHYLELMEPSYEGYRAGTFEFGKYLNDNDYHTYGVEWTPEYVRFFIDGAAYGTVDITSDKYKELLNNELYLDFTVGVNLTEQEVNDEMACWPIDVCIDWLKVYQREGGTYTDRTIPVLEEVPDANTETTPETTPAK